MCTATTAFNMISKHPLWGIKVTCLSLSLRCQYIWCHDVFKSPFANVKINLSLSVNKICNIICAVVTHLILYEEFNHRKRNSFFFLWHHATECTPGSQICQALGAETWEGVYKVICFIAFTSLSSDGRAPNFPQTWGNNMGSEVRSLN